MNNGRKRNRDANENDGADEEELAPAVVGEIEDPVIGFRKKLVIIIIGVTNVMNILMSTMNLGGILPPSFTLEEPYLNGDDEQNEIFQPAIRFQDNLWARIVGIDQFSVDPTRKSEQPFWDTYRGREEDWYKEYRMSQATFNTIVLDCVPFLYSRPTYSLKSARFQYLRAKVVMATLIRYMAIQSDQHSLGKEFGVRQPCVSKRIDRGCRALLSAYWFERCPKPKIASSSDDSRRDAARWFYRKCSIPYLCGSIDGSII